MFKALSLLALLWAVTTCHPDLRGLDTMLPDYQEVEQIPDYVEYNEGLPSYDPGENIVETTTTPAPAPSTTTASTSQTTTPAPATPALVRPSRGQTNIPEDKERQAKLRRVEVSEEEPLLEDALGVTQMADVSTQTETDQGEAKDHAIPVWSAGKSTSPNGKTKLSFEGVKSLRELEDLYQEIHDHQAGQSDLHLINPMIQILIGVILFTILGGFTCLFIIYALCVTKRNSQSPQRTPSAPPLPEDEETTFVQYISTGELIDESGASVPGTLRKSVRLVRSTPVTRGRTPGAEQPMPPPPNEDASG